MTDPADTIKEFLDEADVVFEEYDQGYMDADAALTRLADGIEELEEAYEG